MRRIPGRPSPAMAVAFIALLAALSGTAVALPGKNTVDSGDIKKGAVKRADIARNAVNGSKVGNGSLTGADIRDESLAGADINESSLGQVPSANTANTANTATSATSAATSANADKLDGRDPAELLPASAEGQNPGVGALNAGFTTVVSATITLPYPSRILATGFVEIGANGGDNDAAVCRVEDETGEVGSPDVRVSPQVADTAFDLEMAPISALTAQKPAGAHTINVTCLEVLGDTTADDAKLILTAVG
jgi:hypothetical protein